MSSLPRGAVAATLPAVGQPARRPLVARLVPHGLAAFMAAIFLDSLRYKFTDHPKTQVIFGKLNAWAASIGADGLFGHAGLFSQYVIGSIELLASTLLIAGFLPRYRHLQAAGSLAALMVMAGAVSFHTLTPLGIDPNGDGGGLFAAACVNLAAALLMLTVFRRRELVAFATRFAAVFAPLQP
jgi:hypothetical protein